MCLYGGKSHTLHEEELHDLYPSPYIISGPSQGNEMGGAFRTFGEKRNTRKVLVGKYEEGRGM